MNADWKPGPNPNWPGARADYLGHKLEAVFQGNGLFSAMMGALPICYTCRSMEEAKQLCEQAAESEPVIRATAD